MKIWFIGAAIFGIIQSIKLWRKNHPKGVVIEDREYKSFGDYFLNK